MLKHNLPDTSDLTFHCGVAAYGVVEARLAALPALREQPGWPPERKIPPRFLRHADEQTVVGLAAVLRAMQQPPLAQQCFDDWGVVAAPHFPGRIGGATAMAKFQQEGPATVSPHVIPQHSLHSVSSTISIALAMHGPTFGVGGGPEALAEALSVAMTFFQHGCWPGLWLVLTQWEPEPLPDGLGSSTIDALCRGVALALVPDNDQEWSLRWTVSAADQLPDEHHADHQLASARRAPSTAPLAELAACLTAGGAQSPAGRWSYRLPWGGQVDLQSVAQPKRGHLARIGPLQSSSSTNHGRIV